ncbi:MAG: hypothetical protein ACR2PK_05985 [Acidimicrobiales bacterium]
MARVRPLFLLSVLVGVLAVWSSLPQTDGSEHSTSGGSLQRAEGLPSEARPARGSTTPLESPVEAVPLTENETALIELVADRFAAIGLQLPEIAVSFSDKTADCKWAHGIYNGDEGGHRVRVCVPDNGTFASSLQRQRTLTHEFAHAWDHANLTAADRERLLRIVDASDWYAPEAEWDERGAERFAETIVWGLYEQVRRPVLIDAPCRELHADFYAITGQAALGPVAQGCELQSVDGRTA